MFPNADGYALGSIEGRVAIQYVFLIFFTSLPFLSVGYYLELCEAVAYVLWVAS